MKKEAPIMQNQVFRYDNRIYAISSGYLHVFDTDKVKWTGLRYIQKRVQSNEDEPDDYIKYKMLADS